MTPADLQTFLDENDAEGCIALFSGATEAERRKVASVAATRLRAATAGIPASHVALLPTMSEDLLRLVSPGAVAHRSGLRAAQVAVLATASCGALKKFGERALPPSDDAFAVLADRRPPWLGEWAEAVLTWGGTDGLRFGMIDRWRLVRRLARAGLCERPRTPQYINGMLATLSSVFIGRRSVLQELREDPGLLDDEVWDIFETEPERGMYSLLPANPSTPSEFRWDSALATLAEEGRISRSRLLDASLDGLARDFHELRAKWFALLHEMLRPTSRRNGSNDTSA